jgi:hypothetical protein
MARGKKKVWPSLNYENYVINPIFANSLVAKYWNDSWTSMACRR